MGLLAALLLGAIQGLTEFLPVSSSGHLVLGAHLLGLEEPQLVFDIAVHVATLIAVVGYYRRDVGEMAVAVLRRDFQSPSGRLFGWVVLGSLPTAVIGLLFKDDIEVLFGSAQFASGMLLVSAVLVGSTRFLPERAGVPDLRWWQALVIGTVQGMAILPGISRSGSTISTALWLGVEREHAARFSFLLSLPAILGATLLQLRDVESAQVLSAGLVGGFVSAALVGALALWVFVPMVRRGQLHWFAFYLVPVGVAGLFFWS